MASPVSFPVTLISAFGVPTMRDERAELEWLDRGICGVTTSPQPGVEPGQAAPHHPLVVPPQQRTCGARRHSEQPPGDLHVLLEVHPSLRARVRLAEVGEVPPDHALQVAGP